MPLQGNFYQSIIQAVTELSASRILASYILYYNIWYTIYSIRRAVNENLQKFEIVQCGEC